MTETPRPNHPRRIGATELEQLSAYLDDMLSADVRARLESRLAEDRDLRSMLDGLRNARTILRAAPTLIPPRNFTLDPTKYSRKAPWYLRFQIITLVGALGTAASVALIVLGVLFSGQMTSAPASVSSSTEIARAATDGETTTIAGRLESTERTATSAPMVAALATQPMTATLPAMTSAAGANAAGTGPLPTQGPPATATLGFLAGAADAIQASPTGAMAFSAPAAEPEKTSAAESFAAPTITSNKPPAPAPSTGGSAPGASGGEDASTPEGVMQPVIMPTATPLSTMVVRLATFTAQADMDRSPGAVGRAGPTESSDIAIAPTATTALKLQVESTTATVAASSTLPPTTLTYTPSTMPPIIPRLLLVIGLMLLMISAVILGIGWLRSRK